MQPVYRSCRSFRHLVTAFGQFAEAWVAPRSIGRPPHGRSQTNHDFSRSRESKDRETDHFHFMPLPCDPGGQTSGGGTPASNCKAADTQGCSVPPQRRGLQAGLAAEAVRFGREFVLDGHVLTCRCGPVADGVNRGKRIGHGRPGTVAGIAVPRIANEGRRESSESLAVRGYAGPLDAGHVDPQDARRRIGRSGEAAAIADTIPP